MSSDSASLKSSDNVVMLRRHKELPKTRDSNELSDRELQTFLKVCNHLRNLGDRNTAVITITDDELKIETKHYGSVDDNGNVSTGSILCLSAIMKFEDLPSVEDLKRMIEYASYSDEEE